MHIVPIVALPNRVCGWLRDWTSYLLTPLVLAWALVRNVAYIVSFRPTLTVGLQIPRRLLSPSPFTLERLLAIFHAVLPQDEFRSSIDLHTAFATLTSLRLVTKAGLSGDVLEPAAKFRVSVGWHFVQSLGRNVGLELGDWCFEG